MRDWKKNVSWWGFQRLTRWEGRNCHRSYVKENRFLMIRKVCRGLHRYYNFKVLDSGKCSLKYWASRSNESDFKWKRQTSSLICLFFLPTRPHLNKQLIIRVVKTLPLFEKRTLRSLRNITYFHTKTVAACHLTAQNHLHQLGKLWGLINLIL